MAAGGVPGCRDERSALRDGSGHLRLRRLLGGGGRLLPQRLALVCGERRVTYAELDARANRLANVLLERGVAPSQHLGVYLENCVEYLEVLLAAYKVRAVPINVNFRYVEAELEHLFDDADLVGVVTQPSLVERAEAMRGRCPTLAWVLATGPGGSYEQALSAASDSLLGVQRSGDDPYVLYTGGTTGLPKGVVWRQEDAFFACIGGGDPLRLAGPVQAPAELGDRIIDGGFVYMPVAPLMHTAGQWTALSFLFAGGTVVLLPGPLDPRRVWETVAGEGVNLVTVVGDAVLRPLVDEWERSGPYDVTSLFSIASGGAPLTPAVKARLGSILPGVIVADGFGSSETGAQGAHRIVAAEAGGSPSAFSPYGDTTAVLDPQTLEAVEPGSGVTGRVALRGRIPQRYHKDPERTASTFVEAGGHRWVLTGDLATVAADGTISLLGRGSQVINTGGEGVRGRGRGGMQAPSRRLRRGRRGRARPAVGESGGGGGPARARSGARRIRGGRHRPRAPGRLQGPQGGGDCR